MSERCDVCGPVKHEAPIVLCAPCALLLSFGWDQEEVRRNGIMKIISLKQDGYAEYGTVVVDGLVIP